MSRYLITCGGTGGHLAPGIALAEGLRARGHEVRLLISEKQVDARLVAKYPDLAFLRVPGTPFGWRPLTLARCVVSQLKGVLFCLRLARTWRPDAMVGFGGFTSAPAVLAGRVLGIPVALHEANRVPGRAIRTLGRLAARVYLPPGVTLDSVRPEVTRHVGLPVRREVTRTGVAEARVALGLDPQLPVLAILGGSQGSSPLNAWARARREAFAAAGIQIYCVTGLGKDRAEEAVAPATGHRARMIFVPFSDRIPEVLSAADLVVSRAGAGTLAELVRCGAPAILVPFPQAADDHQAANAAYFARQGGGLVVPQANLTELEAAVHRVLGDERLRGELCASLHRMDQADPLALLLRDLEQVSAGGGTGSDLVLA